MAQQQSAYDIIFANSYLGAFLPEDCTPVVNIFHSCDAAFADLSRKGLGTRDYLQQRYVLGHFERVSARKHYSVAVSSSVERELFEYYGVKADEVIPYSVDTELFTPGSRFEARERLSLPKESRLLLFAGTWGYRKGADLINGLVDRLPNDCRVVAVSQSVDGTVARNSKVIVVKNLPPREMVWAYRAADLFVFPTRAESFGFVTAEALACGIPVITTTAGIGEALRSDPILAPWVVDCPPMLHEIEERIHALLRNRGLCERVGDAGRRLVVRDYSQKAFACRYKHLVERLVLHSNTRDRSLVDAKA